MAVMKNILEKLKLLIASKILLQHQHSIILNPFRLVINSTVSYDEMVLSGSIVQAPERGVITNVDNTLLTFNMGRFDGVERNIYFDIFRDEGVTYHPVTGAPVDPRRTYIGRLVVTDEQDESTQ